MLNVLIKLRAISPNYLANYFVKQEEKKEKRERKKESRTGRERKTGGREAGKKR